MNAAIMSDSKKPIQHEERKVQELLENIAKRTNAKKPREDFRPSAARIVKEATESN